MRIFFSRSGTFYSLVVVIELWQGWVKSGCDGIDTTVFVVGLQLRIRLLSRGHLSSVDRIKLLIPGVSQKPTTELCHLPLMQDLQRYIFAVSLVSSSILWFNFETNNQGVIQVWHEDEYGRCELCE